MSSTMKAIVYERYGSPDVLHLKEVQTPTPTDNEVLVRVHATSVTTFDCWMRSCTSPPGFGHLMRLATGFTKPKQPVLGTELAGEVVAAGKGATRFHRGDQVYGCTGMDLGAYAEYICLSEDAVALKPANTSYEEAAAIPQGALTALYFLREADVQRGQKVLVFGASGGIGTYAVQLAKHFGAEVTGVCSTSKQELVRSLGADEVIDYTKEDFTRNGRAYDVIFDTVGKTSVPRCNRSLKEKGTYLLATFGLTKLIRLLWLSKTSDKKVFFGTLEVRSEDLARLRELIEAGELKPVMDRCYPMDQAGEAHRYVESGRKKGNVVIAVNHERRASCR